MSKKKSSLLLLGVAMLWGLAYPLLKIAVTDVSPSFMLAVRFLLAGIMLLAIFPHRVIGNFSLDLLKRVFIISTVLFADYFCYSTGMQFTTSINGGFYSGIPFLFIPFIIMVLDKKPLRETNFLAIMIILLGIFLLSSDSGKITFNSGDILCFMASFMFGLYITLTGRSAVNKFDPITRATVQMFCVALWAFLIALLKGDMPIIEDIHGSTWICIAIMGVFCTGLSFTMQIFGQTTVNPLTASIIYANMPIFAAIFSMIILRESLGWRGIVGGLVIVCGVIWRETHEHKKQLAATNAFSRSVVD